jgi:DNA polymerase-3 subunit alpha
MENKNSSRPFLSLHCHSNVGSVRDCTASIDEMAKICSKNNMSFSLTDHGWGAGIVQYYRSAKKHKIKPVYGVEFYLSLQRERLFEIRKKLEELKELTGLSKDEKKNVDEEIRNLNYEFEEIKRYNHLIVLAKNEHGLRNLLQLHNIGSLSGFYFKPLITLKELFSVPKDKNGDRGLIVTSSCLSGVIPKDYLNGKDNFAYDHANIMKEELRDDWYLEIQPHELEEQRFVNKKLIDLSKKSNIQLVMGTDSHYLNNDYSKSHEIFLLLQGEQKVEDIGKKIWRITYETSKGETRRKKLDKGEEFNGIKLEDIKENLRISKKIGVVTEEDKWDFWIKKIEETNKVWMIESADLSFKNQRELVVHAFQFPELRPVIDEAIENNKNILEKIEEWEWDNDLKLPIYDNSNERLFDICLDGLKKLNLDKDKIYTERFKKEFLAIKNGGLSSYILLLKEIIDFAKNEDIPVGPGRGSAGASLIFYILGLTRVDPVEWNFPFERFINDKKSANDAERIRLNLDDGRVLDLKPKDIIKLKNGSQKLVKDITEEDDLDI